MSLDADAKKRLSAAVTGLPKYSAGLLCFDPHKDSHSSMSAQSDAEILTLTAQIVSAHVRHNSLQPDALPALIRSVHSTLANIGTSTPAPAEKPQPSVPVKRSVFPDYIVCLEDGKRLKMLKRHLQTAYNMTPDQYRERWGLPHDYPMVAPKYAAHRSSLAKSIGLGRKVAQDAVEGPVEEEEIEIEIEEAAPEPPRRGRRAAKATS
jgi:predicted transcriptional regulator